MQIIQTTEEFKALVQEIKSTTKDYKDPLAFGICKVISNACYHDNKIQYLHSNINENFASAAIFIRALTEQEIEIDFSESEVICSINTKFLQSALNAYYPYAHEAHGDAHKNIQVVSFLLDALSKDTNLEDDYKVIFIFDNKALINAEAKALNFLS